MNGADRQAQQDAQTAIERALEGDFSQAEALFQSLIERGYDSADVYFNLGRAQAAAGRPLDAIVAYEHALLRSPTDAAARADLRALRAALDLPEARAETAGLGVALEPWLSDASALPSVALGVEVVFFLLLAVARFRPLPAWGRWLRNVSGMLWLALLAVLVLAWSVRDDARFVLTGGDNLRGGPDTRYESTAPARAGARVRVVSDKGGWFEIAQPDGTRGWVPHRALSPIN